MEPADNPIHVGKWYFTLDASLPYLRLSTQKLARQLTLNRLSCNTFLIAISSSAESDPSACFSLNIFAAKTTPKLPFPTTLQFV
jgi:hypothetical protein